MKLYYFETPNPRRPVAAAKHLGLDVELVKLNLGEGENKSDEFTAINPNRKVPALVDGETNVWESYAIMLHLAQKAGSDFGPQNDAEQVETLRWAAWDLAHFSRHAGRLLWENFVKPTFDLGASNQEEIDDASGFFQQFAGVLDDHLAGNDYVVGSRLTLTDFGIAAFLPSAGSAKLPLDGFANVARWHEGLLQNDAWANPWPDGGKDM